MKREVRKLRKKWDRLREKALKKNDTVKANLLNRLDQVEQNIRILEERRLSKWDAARIAKEVEIELAELEAMIKAGDEELARFMKSVDNA